MMHLRLAVRSLWRSPAFTIASVGTLALALTLCTIVFVVINAYLYTQLEIYFSVVQRKVVTPNDFPSLRELQDRLLAFQARYEQTAEPFQWAFTRADLAALLAKLKAKELGRVA
jgi:hypothetical protein